MTKLITIILLFTLFACNQKRKQIETWNTRIEEYKSQKQTSSDSSQLNSTEENFRNFTPYALTQAILFDFNGDNKTDSAIFTTRKNKSGVVIKDGKSGRETLIGCGRTFGEMGDDFSWVDSWGLLLDSSTVNVIVKNDELVGEENIVLDNPSIYVRKQESGGGVISYKNGNFIWIHQSD